MKSSEPPLPTPERSGPTDDFPAIRVDQTRPYDSIRELYLYREPELLAAILAGDRRGARKIINHLLVHIYAAGQERSDLLKGFLLELIVMMARAVVQAGVEQTEVLGLHFRHLTELAAIGDEEGLAIWLRGSFERICSAVEKHQATQAPAAVAKALAYLRDNLKHEVSRDEVARRAGVSSGHLSHLLRATTGFAFTELLREYRIQAAGRLLLGTDLPLSEIALECGFCDQSYFSNVFKEAKGMTPKHYRLEGGS